MVITYLIICFSVSDYLEEPSGVMVSNVNMTEITISWTEVNSICPESISYSVTSNCSSVTCATTRNEAICSNLPISGTCIFRIDSEVCGQTETANSLIAVTLRRTLSYSYSVFLYHVFVYNFYRSTSKHNTCVLSWLAFNIN